MNASYYISTEVSIIGSTIMGDSQDKLKSI